MEAAPANLDVVCPFCSLACDDLVVAGEPGRLRVRPDTCEIAEREFARAAPEAATARVDGAPASLEAAIARAAAVLTAARLPLFAGLGTDLAGARAVLALAERTGGILDHAGGAGLMANMRVLQDEGWVATTLAEVRNRADLLLFVATDGAMVAPRFVERCVAPGDTLFGPIRRTCIYLGDGLKPAPGAEVVVIGCRPGDLAGALAALRAVVAGRLPPERAPELAELAAGLRAARYPVVVWSAAELPGGHADLLVGTIAGLVRDLNATGRAAGLPLAGPSNVIGVNQACAWQTGVPLRTSFAAGVPDHDPARWRADRLLAAGAVDALVWIEALRERPPPAGSVPTVALVRAADAVPSAEVVIPVGIPGIDHEGSLYRSDGVVALPARRLREPAAPAVAAVLAAIGELLPP